MESSSIQNRLVNQHHWIWQIKLNVFANWMGIIMKSVVFSSMSYFCWNVSFHHWIYWLWIRKMCTRRFLRMTFGFRLPLNMMVISRVRYWDVTYTRLNEWMNDNDSIYNIQNIQTIIALFRWWNRQLMCGWLCFEIASKVCWKSVETFGKVTIVQTNIYHWLASDLNKTVQCENYSERRVNHEYDSGFNMDNLQFGMQHGTGYNDTVPDLTHIVFLLELIVANPPLFDQNHASFGDAEFKFLIWNEICAAWYKKGMYIFDSLPKSTLISHILHLDQSYCTNFNFQCRFAEQLIHRISK